MSEPLTKADLDRALHDFERDLKAFILEREIKSIRWAVGLQVAYFAITLSAVYFLIHFK